MVQQRSQSGKNSQNAWLRYALLGAVMVVSRPTLHFINQAQRGHPLDINYFWAELSPQNILGFYPFSVTFRVF
jgi:hypothetical protein